MKYQTIRKYLSELWNMHLTECYAACKNYVYKDNIKTLETGDDMMWSETKK